MSTKNRSKKSSKSTSSSKSEVKVGTNVSEVAKIILKFINAKPGHYTRNRIREKLTAKYDVRTIVAARKLLFKQKKFSIVDGKLQPRTEKA